MIKKNIFKRLVASFLFLVILLSSNVIAADEIQVVINGTRIISDVAPEIIKGRTMIPLRSTLESLGAKVDWISETKTATALTDEYSIKLKVNSLNVEKIDLKTNEKINYKMDVAPTIKNNRTLVPVRFMAELLGKKVVWDSNKRTVIILDESYINNYLEKNASNFLKLLDAKIDTQKQNVANGEISINEKIYDEKNAQVFDLKINYDIKMLMTEDKKFDKMALKIDIKLNEELNKLLKTYTNTDEIDFSKVDYEMYIDREKTFMNSSLLKEKSIQKLVLENTEEKVDISKGVTLILDDEEMIKQFEESFNQKQNEMSTKEIKEFFISSIIDTIETPEDVKNMDMALKCISLLSSEKYLKISEDKITYELTLDELIKIVTELFKENEDISKIIENYKTMIKAFNLSYNLTSEKADVSSNVEVNILNEAECKVSADSTSRYDANIQITVPNTNGSYELKMSELNSY